MRHRLDPWPAVADLFSALLVACFAALVLIAATHSDVLRELRILAKPEVHVASERMLSELTDEFKKLPGAQPQPCGVERCIDVPVPFETNKWEISDESYRGEIARACGRYKQVLAKFKGREREIQLIIEGHTDSQQPTQIKDPKEKFLFNWQLSAKRAGSILYEFKNCGVTPEEYNIVAAGYADTVPRCRPANDPNCFSQNRRTTLRLRADAALIEEHLKNEKKPH